ncbi:MAG: PLP-dependent cysteine synthase family protein [Pseudomonadota bacterium]
MDLGALPVCDHALEGQDRAWVCQAIDRIMADYNRSSDTHLIRLDLPCLADVDIYLKDESTHPSGSLKHRLARSLFLYALCNGLVRDGTPIIESSSGSTAISEAYFARLLGLRFIAVVPKTTAQEKLDKIEFYGGECHLVEPQEIYREAEDLAERLSGHYMDQFTYAERATDWRGNNNIAESIFAQLARERHSVPDWIVVSAGTGGTSATIGRFLRYKPELYGKARLCVVDPEFSVFYDSYTSGDRTLTAPRGSRIEGIGRPRVEPSFQPAVIDRMLKIPDAASLATIRWLEGVLGRKCGASTGTNVYGTLQIVAEMLAEGRAGSVVSMICDPGERYLHSYYDEAWLEEQGIDIQPYLAQLERFADSGGFAPT